MCEDVAWLAGILEGEGYFGLRRAGSSIYIQLSMVDGDVVERAQRIFGAGSIKTRVLPSGKTCYTLSVLRQEDAKSWMERLLPYMGQRRAARIRDCLDIRAKFAEPRRNWTHCSHGHPFGGSNLRIQFEGKYRKRRCLECCKLRQRKHRAKAAQIAV